VNAGHRAGAGRIEPRRDTPKIAGLRKDRTMGTIRFDVSREDALLIGRIVTRAVDTYEGTFDSRTLAMDLTACHANGCPLDLAAFANGEAFDFAHDVGGISRHMDRSTGKLGGHFLPRFTRRAALAEVAP
jgi:hypothetical protein